MKTKLLELARDCLGRSDYAEAKLLCQQVLSDNPSNLEAMRLSGIAAINSNDFSHAILMLSQVVLQVPGSAVDHYNLGLAYNNANDANSAVQHFQKSVDIQPNLTSVYADFCLALIRCGNIDSAITVGKMAVKLLPDSSVAHYNLAQAYDEWKDYILSYKHYQRAADLFPDHPGVQLSLAAAYVGVGKIDAASECYRKVISLYPEDVEAYRQLARIKSFSSPNHDDVIKLKSILSQAWLNDDDRVSIYFALGKVYQDCKLYDDAFAYFNLGNQLQDAHCQFVPEEFADYVTSIIDVSKKNILNKKSAMGDASEVPVFIVGVPRSGTSLVEQVLASHPDVYGAGELDWFLNTANSLPEKLETMLPYPQCLVELDEKIIEERASDYLGYIQSLSGNTLRVVDKMPGNFLYLNLIHILFPSAKIIHCRRNSRDSCISMYTEYFPDGVPYSYNLLNLGAFYKQYERIMEHWRTVIPAHLILEVEYEDMVQNQEKSSRRLVDFVGLQWNEACLNFYQKQRRVDTASDLQVKKPIYSTSIGRWKNYEKYLRALNQGFEYWK